MAGARKAVCGRDIAGLPVDRGYAWVIAFACLFCNLLSLGVQRAYGILFVEFLRMFHMSAGVTAIILAAQSAVTSIAALLTQTVMLSFLSVRQTVVIGGFIGGLGLILSFFAESIYTLYFTISVLVGLSLAFILGPAVVIVGVYFEKRRSLASAIASLGGNIGSTIIPPYAQALIDAFGGRGALLLLGATCLNVMVGGLLLRPLHLNKRRRHKTEQQAEEGVANNETAINKIINNHCSQDDADETKAALVQRKAHRQASVNSTGLPHSELSAIGSLASLDLVVLPQEMMASAPDDPSDEEDNTHGTYKEDAADDGSQPSGPRDTKPLARASSDAKLRPNGTDRKQEKRTLFSKFLALFDFGLFKNPKFLLVLTSFSFGIVPTAHYGTYLPPMAVDKGFTGEDAALLLAIFGGCGIVARLFFGFFADLNLIPRPLLTGLLLGGCSLAGFFTPLYNSFASLIVFSVVYGILGPVFFSIAPVVIIDLLGLRNLSPTLGFVHLFQGVAVAAIHPIIELHLVMESDSSSPGSDNDSDFVPSSDSDEDSTDADCVGHLRDVTGSYNASFHLMSSCGLLAALVLIMTSIPCKTQCLGPKSRSRDSANHQKTSTLLVSEGSERV